MSHLERTIQAILGFDTHGAAALTLYLHADPSPQPGRDVVAAIEPLIRPVRARVAPDAIASALLETALRDATTAIHDALEADGTRAPPPRAIGAFACPTRGFAAAICLPRRAEELALWADYFFLRPLIAAVDETERALVVLVDARAARFFRVDFGEIEPLGSIIDDDASSSHHQAGASHQARTTGSAPAIRSGYGERNLQRQRGWRIRRHLDHALALIEERHGPRSNERILIGGGAQSARQLRELLTPRLASRAHILSRVPMTSSTTEILAAVTREMTEIRHLEENELVTRLLELDPGRAVLGPAAVAQAVAAGQVQTFVYAANVAVRGAWCPACRWIEESDGAHACPRCSAPMRPTHDLADRIADAVMHLGGRVEEVESDAAAMLGEARGMAAVLRYSPTPMTAPSGA